jgi:hypothetical protein
MKYEYLISRADKLPPNWATVYAAARMADEEIQKMIDQGVLNNHAVMGDLDGASGKTAKLRSRATAVITSNTVIVPASSRAPGWSFQVQLDPILTLRPGRF